MLVGGTRGLWGHGDGIYAYWIIFLCCGFIFPFLAVNSVCERVHSNGYLIFLFIINNAKVCDYRWMNGCMLSFHAIHVCDQYSGPALSTLWPYKPSILHFNLYKWGNYIIISFFLTSLFCPTRGQMSTPSDGHDCALLLSNSRRRHWVRPAISFVICRCPGLPHLNYLKRSMRTSFGPFLQ